MATTSTQLSRTIAQFTSRYRNALLAKVGLLCVLGAGVVATLAWRLRTASIHLPISLSLGIPMALGMLAAVGLAWWTRRRWIAPNASASYLDRALGLQQRLITVEEIGRREELPPLYPLLIEDTVQRCATERARIPTLFDRSVIALGVVLLLLLLSLRIGRAPIQLAKLPSPTMPPSPHDMPPPSPPQRSDQSQQQNSTQQQGSSPQQQQSASPSGGSQQQPSGNSPTDHAQPSSGHPQQLGSSNNQHSSGSSPAAPSSPQRPEQRSSQPSSSSGQGSSTGNTQQPDRSQVGAENNAQPQTGNRQQPSQQPGEGSAQSNDQSDQRAQAQTPNASAGQNAQANDSNTNNQSKAASGQSQRQNAHNQGTADQRTGQSQTNASSAGQSTASAEQRSGESTQRANANGQTASQAHAAQGNSQGLQPSGQGGSPSAADQQALKAEIQQLLKDVSGELQQLQTQLDTSKDQTPSTPGTGSDPQLYESPMSIDPVTGRPVPIQLKPDTSSATSKRQSSGVGTPSGEVSADTPTVSPQEAQLSDKPLQESATDRQTVPFEYRDVFGRLHRRSLPTGEMPQ